jgi:mannose/fructose/N-acetylgalactosamine-specific phosphotransferase system component IID
LPALRVILRDRPADLPAALARHEQVFNTHPYLATIAVGAVARMEAERIDPDIIEKFKTAVRGALGGLGDRLIWAGWRPVCALLALLLLLGGAAWWICVFAFLLVYNVGHIAARVWGLRLGLHYGREVGEKLRQLGLPQAQRGLATAGAFLLGMVLPIAAAGAPGARVSAPWLILTALAAIAGVLFGNRVRTPVILSLTALALLGLGLRFIS